MTTYRNDHEAAIMRVDALEQEVARLRTAAPAPVPVATKRRSRASVRAGLTVAALGVAVIAFIARDRPVVVAAPAEIVETPQPGLRACAEAIAPVPGDVDEHGVDPRGAAGPTAWIADTGARCRAELRDAANAAQEPELKSKLERWADAEDRLADPISLITVYYDNDPYALDNYSTAPQLWREYHRARRERDRMLDAVRPVLAGRSATR